MAPLLDRFRRWAAPERPGGPAVLPEDDVLDFLYPYSREDPAERDRLRVLLRQCTPIRSLADIRPFLSRAEQQAAPSPVTLRFGRDQLATYEVEGLVLFALRDDPAVSEEILRGDVYEPHVDASLRRLCRPGDVALDIGANIGVHTFLMSALVGPTGTVIAVEPNSENCRLIILGMLHNQITNVTLWPVALSSAAGWSYYATHYGSNGGLVQGDPVSIAEGRGVVIPVFPLDSLSIPRPVSLIKLDVEGAEGLVMAGATTILEEDRPAVLTELSAEMLERVSGMTLREYLHMFLSLGYSLRLIERPSGQWIPTTVEEIESWRRDEPYRIDDLVLLPPTGPHADPGAPARSEPPATPEGAAS
ncbi:MAG TPA: FkbM family methyltransferase [Acidimicrobiales bacterium]|nr:FkbM family methyltransferase [Acidimicrobiales bacterium]